MTMHERLSRAETLDLSRRGFLAIAGGAGVGLMIGLKVDPAAAARAGAAPTRPSRSTRSSRSRPTARSPWWSSISTWARARRPASPPSSPRRWTPTGAQMRTEFAPADANLYANLAFKAQGTGGSTAMANSWEQYRTAGATARAMLVKAAADKWQVAAGRDHGRQGRAQPSVGQEGHLWRVRRGRRQIAGADRRGAADAVQGPVQVQADRQGRRCTGSTTTTKTDGTAIYTQDVKLPGMLVAVVAHAAALRRQGRRASTLPRPRRSRASRQVVQIPQGVAVLAKNTWAAISGRNALKVEWDDSGAETRGSRRAAARWRKDAVSKPGVATATNKGDAEAALKGAAKVIEAEFTFPYLAHAPMEPLNCVVELTPRRRAPDLRRAVPVDRPADGRGHHGPQARTGQDRDGLGRRLVRPPRGADRRTTCRSRHDRQGDRRQGAGQAGLDPRGRHQGRLLPAVLRPQGHGGDRAGRHAGRMAATASPASRSWPAPRRGDDGQGRRRRRPRSRAPRTSPTRCRTCKVELTTLKVGVPVLWWRSVGHTHTAHVVESMIDELAFAAGQGPGRVPARAAQAQAAPHRGAQARGREGGLEGRREARKGQGPRRRGA